MTERRDRRLDPHAAWYRHLWPWIVIGLIGSAVAGSLASAYLAVHTTDVVLEHADASN